jgi:citrate lyase subunit beta / citryl-CoA lyase
MTTSVTDGAVVSRSSVEQWHRSMMFVPGNRPEWMAKAATSGADGLIFDLEDSVPVSERDFARAAVRDAIEDIGCEGPALYVRVNGWHTGSLLTDVEAVVRSTAIDGILLAKTDGSHEIMALDLVLSDLERKAGLPVGHTKIFASPETASGLRDFYQLCIASPRVAKVVAGSSNNGDINRALGYQWTPTGEETDHILTRAILDAKAAGVSQVYRGVITRVSDLELVEMLAKKARRFGATGSLIIHPSHIEIINRVFAPSSEEVERAAATILAMMAAVQNGRAAVRLADNDMVDYAHVKSAVQLLERARHLGIETPRFDEAAYRALVDPLHIVI